MRALVVILLVLGGAGCGGEGSASATPGEAPPEAVAPEVSEEPATSDDAPIAPGLPGEPGPTAPEDSAAPGPTEGDLCTRARACCRAYVTAIPSARRRLEERGCTEMDAVLSEAGEAADDVCEAAIGGWRQSLQLTGVEVPADWR